MAWFWSDRRINKVLKYKIIGLKNILNEQLINNGVLLFFKHSLHLELDARLLAMNLDVYGVERAHNSNSFDSIQTSGRLKSMKGTCDRNNPIRFIIFKSILFHLIETMSKILLSLFGAST